MSAITPITLKGTLYEVYHDGNLVLRILKYYPDTQVAREVHLDELPAQTKEYILTKITDQINNTNNK